MKNAGVMRMIRKRNVADSISSIDVTRGKLNIYNGSYFSNMQTGYTYAEELVNVFDVLPFFIKNQTVSIAANIHDTISIKINTATLNTHLSFMMRQKSFAYQEIGNYKNLAERTLRLIELIKKEYDLEED